MTLLLGREMLVLAVFCEFSSLVYSGQLSDDCLIFIQVNLTPLHGCLKGYDRQDVARLVSVSAH
jgi:hypothetical protein